LSQYPDSSQYCIYIYNNDLVHIWENELNDFNQGGIRLDRSDAKIDNNIIRECEHYGMVVSLYSDAEIEMCDIINICDPNSIGLHVGNNSDPTVRWCIFDSVYTGVKIASSVPDLGRNVFGDTSKFGYNNFKGCERYFIYQKQIAYPMPLIKAEENYYGRFLNFPDSCMYGNIDYTPWRTRVPRSRLSLGKFIDVDIDIPSVFELNSNYPNPFNPNTSIKFSLAEPGYTTITIYNILGQRVIRLVDEYKEAGQYAVIWNGQNSRGQPVTSGIYFYRIESGDFVDSKKMMLLR